MKETVWIILFERLFH